MFNIAILENGKPKSKVEKINEAANVVGDCNVFRLSERKCVLFRDSQVELLYCDNKVVNGKIDAAISAVSTTNDQTMHTCILSFLEKEGVFLLQPQVASIIDRNKYLTYQKLSEADIQIPRTVAVTKKYLDFQLLDSIIRKEIGREPFLIKKCIGTKGIGVNLFNNTNDLFAYIKEEENNKSGVYLIQEYITPIEREDERHIVIGEKVVNSVRRVASEDSFITNVDNGATLVPMTCDKETEEICVKAAHAVGLHYCGVDIIRDKNGTPCVLETNQNPSDSIIDATGHNHYIELLQYIKEKLKTK